MFFLAHSNLHAAAGLASQRKCQCFTERLIGPENETSLAPVHTTFIVEGSRDGGGERGGSVPFVGRLNTANLLSSGC